MEWIETADNEIRLADDINTIATLRRLPYPPFNWVLSFDNRFKIYASASPAMLKYMATGYINNCCNDIISGYEWVQNSLPDWTTLAEEAGIFDEME